MKRKIKLRILQILCIISILITVFSIQRTYAKYFEKVDTTYQTNIKRWLINVNTFNVHEMTELNQVMQPVLVANDHMNNNDTLVPGREGYFVMDIDYSSVDLAFEYEFFIEQLNSEPLTDFKIYGYEVVDGENSTVTEIPETPEIPKIKGVIDPTTELNSKGEKKREIRVLFRWNDGTGSTMDNVADTQFRGDAIPDPGDGTEPDLHTTLKYKATMKFTQYVAPVEENPMS